ncbi:CLUMA_CG016995, isoform D [Clunio marinus]|uniref:CLUMA_CG016995, isoform D n=1 Tax=Clunio marinus TaxID=568069 RepID=A0A1J1IXH2_9DIPT|nr:CLUMA_CG016995, isoform D [Clunio marinus]
MSVQFTQNPQQIVHINDDDDGRQHLQSPRRVALDRMTSRSDKQNPYAHVQEQLTQVQLDSSREERNERARVRKIFDKYDVNRDGFLQKKELKRLVKEAPSQCADLPKGLAKAILKLHDHDASGHLDFEEFYKLSREHHWLVRDMCVKYCRYVVPRRDGSVFDETDGAYESQMKFFPPPLTMIIFSIVEIIFFIVDIIHLQDYKDGDVKTIGTSVKGPAATLFIYNPSRREEAWRFVTYMFVHVGVMHIMMNLLVQIFLGTALELVHCWWRVALVYLAGVLAGSMGTSIASPRIYLAGASGGVYALITAHIATIIMNWKDMEYAVIQLFVFLVFCTTDIGFSIYRHLNDPFDRVGYTAHLCGAIAGLLVGIGVLRNLNVQPHEKVIWWIAVTIYLALMAFGICVHVFPGIMGPDFFPPSTVRLFQTPVKSGLTP